MRKSILLTSVLSFIFLLVGCQRYDTEDKNIIYKFNSDIHSLKVNINTTNFIIKKAENFTLESNLDYLSISEEDGLLKILEESKRKNSNNDVIILYIPENIIFEDVNITTGVSNIMINTLDSKNLILKSGTGNVNIENINISYKTDIENGTGKVNIVNSIINNLNLKMGIGELRLNSALFGNNNLNLDVGKSNIILFGSRDDYTLNIEKGIGNVIIDGKNIFNITDINNGANHIGIKGGVGEIDLKFQNSENHE